MVDKCENQICKRSIALFGINRQRVTNVLALFKQEEEEIGKASTENNIEYMACVAGFGGYRDENGDMHKYLAKVEYHDSDGNNPVGKSLAPLLDDEEGDLVAIVIGCGIDDEKDQDMVKNFVATLFSGKSTVDEIDSIVKSPADKLIIEFASPSDGFNSMLEENMYFRGLANDERQEVFTTRKMGPGKMVTLLSKATQRVMGVGKRKAGPSNLLNSDITNIHKSSTNECDDDIMEIEVEMAPSKSILPSPDSNRNRFACKICRTILFGEKDLENPPHTKGKHSFSRLKSKSSNGATKCNNIFLSAGLDWMGDMSAFEGRLECPKCSSKVGHWNWSGAQCSCGSWVTPAIYFPQSKVDIKEPLQLKSVTIPIVFQ